MRQLNQTGFIPNRIPMISAGFLVKELLIGWRKGENHPFPLVDHKIQRQKALKLFKKALNKAVKSS